MKYKRDGSFFGYDLYKFHTYKFVDGRYVLYDESENVVGDILVTGNNRLEIKLRRWQLSGFHVYYISIGDQQYENYINFFRNGKNRIV